MSHHHPPPATTSCHRGAHRPACAATAGDRGRRCGDGPRAGRWSPRRRRLGGRGATVHAAPQRRPAVLVGGHAVHPRSGDRGRGLPGPGSRRPHLGALEVVASGRPARLCSSPARAACSPLPRSAWPWCCAADPWCGLSAWWWRWSPLLALSSVETNRRDPTQVVGLAPWCSRRAAGVGPRRGCPTVAPAGAPATVTDAVVLLHAPSSWPRLTWGRPPPSREMEFTGWPAP